MEARFLLPPINVNGPSRRSELGQQYGPMPEISINFDPATRCYGFSVRLPGIRPHWIIDTFASLEDVTRWVDPWKERVWKEPSDANERCSAHFEGAGEPVRCEWRRCSKSMNGVRKSGIKWSDGGE